MQIKPKYRLFQPTYWLVAAAAILRGRRYGRREERSTAPDGVSAPGAAS